MAVSVPLEFRLEDVRTLKINVQTDWILVVQIVAVLVASLMVLYSALSDQPQLFYRHTVLVGIGVIGFVVVSQFRAETIYEVAPYAYIGVIGLLLLVVFFGDASKGARRWLDLPGPIPRFQPSELLKIATPLMLAWYLHNKPYPVNLLHLFVAGVILVIPAALIYLQPDLGSTLLLTLGPSVIFFLAGMSWRLIGLGLLGGLVAAPFAWFYLLYEYQRERVWSLLNPSADKLDRNWNTIQSEIALGSGGVAGKGWLEGTQLKLEFLPEGHTDFILAVLGEEWGLIGCTAVLALLMVIFIRGLMLSANAEIRFARYAIAGFITTFFIYVLVNTLMVSGILPVVGVPLPLISYGGTSVITYLLGFGIVVALYKNRQISIRGTAQ